MPSRIAVCLIATSCACCEARAASECAVWNTVIEIETHHFGMLHTASHMHMQIHCLTPDHLCMCRVKVPGKLEELLATARSHIPAADAQAPGNENNV